MCVCVCMREHVCMCDMSVVQITPFAIKGADAAAVSATVLGSMSMVLPEPDLIFVFKMCRCGCCLQP